MKKIIIFFFLLLYKAEVRILAIMITHQIFIKKTAKKISKWCLIKLRISKLEFFYFVLLSNDEIYIKISFHILLQANQCAMVHVPFDDETFLNVYSLFFLSFLTYYLYKYLMKRCTHAHLPLDGQLEDTNEYIYVYIRNQTPERNANIVVLSYRFNRDKAIERISKKILSFSHLFEHYDFFLCVNRLWSFIVRSIIGEI